MQTFKFNEPKADNGGVDVAMHTEHINYFFKFSSRLLLVLMLSMAFVGSAFAKEMTIDCDSESDDYSAIQGAIDAAKPGDRIRLNGTCLLAKNEVPLISKSHLTITGNPVVELGDPTGWTELVGTDGEGANNSDNGCFQNRGFVIGSNDPDFNGTIKNVTISNLKFTNFARGININGDLTSRVGVDNLPSEPCPEGEPASIGAKNITIKHNWFENPAPGTPAMPTVVYIGVLANGSSNNLHIQNNLFDNFFGVIVEGQFRLSTGERAGRVHNLKVQDNQNISCSGYTITTVESGLVSGNSYNARPFGDNAPGGPSEDQCAFYGRNGYAGFGFSEGIVIDTNPGGAAMKVNVNGNNVNGARELGGIVLLDQDGAVSVVNNTSSNNGTYLGVPADIWLWGTTNTKVINSDCDTVVLETSGSADNKIIGKQGCP